MTTEPEVPFEALAPEPAWEAIGNRVCHEPVAMARMMSELREGPMMRGLPEIDESKHPYEGNCRQCGIELDVKWIQVERCVGWFPVNCHQHCKEAYLATIGVAALQGEMWQKVCPPDFRAPWDARKGNAGLLKRVMAFDPRLGRGLLIRGTSGTGKTRCAWALTRQIMEMGMAVAFVASIDLPDENAKDMINAQCLVIDDLGNDKMQATKEALVLKILRARMDWRRPTIITTQFDAKRLTERFSDGHTAQAVVRRLREFCEDISA